MRGKVIEYKYSLLNDKHVAQGRVFCTRTNQSYWPGIIFSGAAEMVWVLKASSESAELDQRPQICKVCWASLG